MKKAYKKEIKKTEKPEPENTRGFRTKDEGYQEDVYNAEEEKNYNKSDNAKERKANKT